MAPLIGYLQGSRGETSRLGSKASGIRSRLETWSGQVQVHLDADGSFYVGIGSKNGGGSLAITGNVDDGKRRIRLVGTSSVSTGERSIVFHFDSPVERDRALALIGRDDEEVSA